ncbi:PQQ-binding-like beta-propeller repeat protein [Candidatus Formimonas warabiya]|uniref:BIG2 domain-containing protein n=1 Tax=Formimonas warabiya TaxID=1761012 RepID=A0A3G1KYL3_FORW1|nr:PQQ-binding-like beta-propeller repeat protein [Candidatus Formimonas warabiya]ATW27568.1 hypothetical protein DCMF_24945 [Candidatus Formimonas warabiya]
MKRKSTGILIWLCTALLWAGIWFAPPVQAGTAEAGPALDWVRDTAGKQAWMSGGQLALPSNTWLRYDESPTVDEEGNAYLTPTNGYLYSIDPEGEMNWKADLDQAGDCYNTGGKGPVLDEEGNCYIASGDGRLYAVDGEGNVLWTCDLEKVCTGTSPALSPDGDTVYVSAEDHYLYAVDRATGTEEWRYYLGGTTISNTPVVAPDGTIYVGSGSVISAVYPDGSRRKWLKSFSSYKVHVMRAQGDAWSGEQRMAVDEEGDLYLAMSNREAANKAERNVLVALKAGDGSEKWHIDVNQRLSAPAVDGDILYYKTADNVLHALDRETGAEQWTYQAEDQLYGLDSLTYYCFPPRVDADGTVVVAFGTALYAVNPDGTLKWTTGDTGYALNAPSVYGPRGELYVVGIGEDGKADVPSLLKFTDESYAPEPAELALPEGDFGMLAGAGYTCRPEISDSYGRQVYQADLVWESSDPAVATVDDTRLVTALKAGRTRISVRGAENPEVRAEVTVTVFSGTAGVSLELSSAVAQVEISKVTTLQANLAGPENLTLLGETLEWVSMSPSIASVNQAGTVTGVAGGQAVIRARVQRYPALEGKITVTVQPAVVKTLTLEEIKEAMELTLDWYRKNQGAPEDWAAFGLNAAGEDITGTPYLNEEGKTYLENQEKDILESGVGGLMTDYERTVMGVVSAGGDPTNIGGMDLIDTIVRWPGMGQGINAAVWGLIALDGAHVPDPTETGLHDREDFIDYILDNRAGEGWAYGSTSPDPDMTGMALYALAPYRERPDVKAAGEKAIAWLSRNQNYNGKFGSWGTENSESCAQAIMGLTAWGIDPQGGEFTKLGGNGVTGFLDYQIISGSDRGVFKHADTADTALATDQALEALAALVQFYEEGTSHIFYRIEAAGSPAAGEITSLDVYPAGLVLKPEQSIPLRAKNQKGLYVDNSLLAWQVSDGTKAEIREESDGEGNVSYRVQALAPGPVTLTVALKDDGAIRGTAILTVAGKDFTAERLEHEQENDGDYLELGAAVTNISSSAQTALIQINVYREDTGELVHQSFAGKDFAPGETYQVTGFYQVPAADRDQYQMKVLVWDKWLRARPLADVIVE